MKRPRPAQSYNSNVITRATAGINAHFAHGQISGQSLLAGLANINANTTEFKLKQLHADRQKLLEELDACPSSVEGQKVLVEERKFKLARLEIALVNQNQISRE